MGRRGPLQVGADLGPVKGGLGVLDRRYGDSVDRPAVEG